ncbi:hypothetical protein J5N97_003774 [Dioscorea zingiberensis]|uniref:Myb/SANT-like domain-containing protein n=1 Tax=Dioscorea zingiberensis TaxID=325984 RepID=A0A9D5D780_9LILI|nr:hypothetical protein J5N97_003774 [Dioscorea zingiberensis]
MERGQEVGQLIEGPKKLGSFRPEAWVRIWNAYQKRTNEDITVLQLKGRWKTLKKLYKLYSSLVNKSGWSWDEGNHQPTPGDMNVWEEIIEHNKEFKVCRDKPFPLYWKIHNLVSSSTATGEYATHTGGGVHGGSLYVDVETSTDSTDTSNPAVQEIAKDTDQAPRRRNKNISYSVGSKRTSDRDPSPRVSKRKSSDTNMELIDRLVTMTDRRSKITERRRDETDQFSFDACMLKLFAIPGIGPEEACAAVEALKCLEQRIFFIRMPMDFVEYWLNLQVKEFRRRAPPSSPHS